jgi:hypothetical protein
MQDDTLDSVIELGKTLKGGQYDRFGRALVVWYDIDGGSEQYVPLHRLRCILIHRGLTLDDPNRPTLIHILKPMQVDGLVRVGTQYLVTRPDGKLVQNGRSTKESFVPVDMLVDTSVRQGPYSPDLTDFARARDSKQIEHIRAFQEASYALSVYLDEMHVNRSGDVNLRVPRLLVPEPRPGSHFTLRYPIQRSSYRLFKDNLDDKTSAERKRLKEELAERREEVKRLRALSASKQEIEAAERVVEEAYKIMRASQTAYNTRLSEYRAVNNRPRRPNPLEDRTLWQLAVSDFPLRELCTPVRGEATYDPQTGDVQVRYGPGEDEFFVTSESSCSEDIEERIQSLFGPRLYVKLYPRIPSGASQNVSRGKALFGPLQAVKRMTLAELDNLDWDTYQAVQYMTVLAGRQNHANLNMYDATLVVPGVDECWADLDSLPSRMQHLRAHPDSFKLVGPGYDVDLLHTTTYNKYMKAQSSPSYRARILPYPPVEVNGNVK